MQLIPMPQQSEKGATLVEFAIAAAFLILMLGGIFDIGLALHNYTLLQNVTEEAAREIGARVAMEGNCDEVPRFLDEVATPRLRDDLGADVNEGSIWSVRWKQVGEFWTMELQGTFSSGCYFICQLTPDAFRISGSHEIVFERGNMGCPDIN